MRSSMCLYSFEIVCRHFKSSRPSNPTVFFLRRIFPRRADDNSAPICMLNRDWKMSRSSSSNPAIQLLNMRAASNHLEKLSSGFLSWNSSWRPSAQCFSSNFSTFMRLVKEEMLRRPLSGKVELVIRLATVLRSYLRSASRKEVDTRNHKRPGEDVLRMSCPNSSQL